MSFGYLRKRGKRKINQYIFLYCCEAQCISCARRCVAEYDVNAASYLCCQMAGLRWARHRGRHVSPQFLKFWDSLLRLDLAPRRKQIALGSQASAPNSVERPPTQTRQHKKHTQKYARHKHKHKNANTNKKRKHTNTKTHKLTLPFLHRLQRYIVRCIFLLGIRASYFRARVWSSFFVSEEIRIFYTGTVRDAPECASPAAPLR